jgi:poly-gamma-glutamate synthesis protein (capsule biosynthesis protein)
LLVVLVTVGVVALARSPGDGDPSRVAGSGTTPAPAAPPEAAEGEAAPTRGELGSGQPVTLAFGGDVHFESPIRERLSDPSSVLAAVAPVLSRADIAMVNVETAITEGGTPAPKNFVFRAPASGLEAMRAGGVDVVTMANNHGMDYGVSGLRDSLRAARATGVPVVGIGLDEERAYAPFRATVRGQRVAIIGATQVLDDNLISEWTADVGKPGLASARREDRLVAAVQEARETSDTVVVYLHWGVELSECPTDTQRSLARRLVDAGADVIVGGHAHVLAGGGRMGRAVVHYGLGNFVFYASREATVRSGVFEVTVTGRRIDRYRWVPARISGGVPRPLSGDDGRQAVRSWNELRSCTDLTQ